MTMIIKALEKRMRRMKAGEFKAKCLAVMDEVAESGEPVVITKRGKPIARLVPELAQKGDLLEFIRKTGKIVDPNDDLIETFTAEEIADFERHLMEEADEFLTPVPPENGEGRDR